MTNERIVSLDPGLLTKEQLLDSSGSRRASLEYMISQDEWRQQKDEHILNIANVKERITWFLDHARFRISYQDFMMIITIYALFGDDIRLLTCPPSADSTFVFLNTLTFFLFLQEIILTSWIKSDFSRGIWKVKGYMFSFFFWMDLLAIISLFPEIPWLASWIRIGAFENYDTSRIAGFAGKIGSKVGKVIKMVRLVRLVKLFKLSSQRRREKSDLQGLTNLIENGHISTDELEAYMSRITRQKQSKVGSELSDIITRRVIIAVLLMLCAVPLLSYSSSDQKELQSTEFLQSINIEAGYGETLDCDQLVASTDTYKEFMQHVFNNSKYETNQNYLVSLRMRPHRCNKTDLVDTASILNKTRATSIIDIITKPAIVNSIEYSVEATFDLTSFVKKSALSRIYLTFFVIFMLVALSTQFIGDSEKLVLAPIDSMMEMVNRVAADPLEDFDFSSMAMASEYETQVVQTAIKKMTTLLRIGFGVAGAEIISSNMAVEGEGSLVLEPMIPGKRVYAIFGFCDIHAFDHCTEVLEDEIMLFVNSVARIVHEQVTRWGGLCNKNLGNAWLMVWRIGDHSALQGLTARRSSNKARFDRRKSLSAKTSNLPNSNFSVDLRRIPGLDILSDKALIGFLKVVVEINRDPQILSYRDDSRLRRDNKNYKLSMGFGMHVGWAIEGAVGSLQKVDATYLSPHVNMAARMEAASKQFGVAILMTERFYELMSSDAQSFCRKIDVVTVKGSAIAMPIYTYDTLQNQTFPQLKTPKFTNLSLREVLNTQAHNYDPTTWENDGDLAQLRVLSTPKFIEVFQSGVEFYLCGNWGSARKKLEEADDLMKDSDVGGDGPSRTLLNYMRARDWICPPDWRGYRPLTSK